MAKSLFPDIDETLDPELLQPGQEGEQGDNGDDNNSGEDYQFIDGDLDNFMQEFEQHKEDMGIVEKPSEEEFEEVAKENLPKNTARKTGKFIARVTDNVCATGLSLISGCDKKRHQTDPESLKELTELLTEYISETGGEIPISVQILIFIIVNYALQVPGAIKIRKVLKR